jgi:hypothetical protein
MCPLVLNDDAPRDPLPRCVHKELRSYWIPGSWNLRMVYTDAISFYDP